MTTSNNAVTAVVESRSLAASYGELGWALTRVRHGDKQPIDDGWQSAPRPTRAELGDWFDGARFNIGLRTGALSGGLVDLDCDDERLAPYLDVLAPDWLRASPRWTRGGRPHLLTAPVPLPGYRKYIYAGSTVLELRGDGHQSVLPPSLHPSGERYRWLSGPHQPPSVPLEELSTYVENVLLAFALGQGWHVGTRQDLSLAAAGWLARRGWSPARAAQVIDAAARVAGDDEAAKRVRAVEDSFRTVAAGEPATGWPTLTRLLPDEAVRLLLDVFPRGEQQEEHEERSGLYVVRDGVTYLRIPPRRDGGDWT
jgi:hypothetical protein